MAFFAGAVASVLLGIFGVWLLERANRTAVSGVAAQLTAWITWAAVKVLPAISATIAKAFVDTLGLTQDAWGPAMAVLVSEITGEEVTYPVGAAGAGKDKIANLVRPLVEPLTRAIRDAVAPPGELTPEKAQDAVTNLLSITTALNVEAWWFELLADALSVGHLRAFNDLRSALDQSLALQRLGFHLWRAPLTKGVTEPLTQLYDRTYAIKLLGVAEVVTGYLRRVYTFDQYIDAMRGLGYNYDRAVAAANIREELIGVSEATELWHEGMIDEATHTRLIKERGFGDTRAEFIAALERGRGLRTILRSIASELQALYRHGDLTEQELRDTLPSTGVLPAEVDALVTLTKVQRRNELRLTEAQLLEALREGVLTDVDVRERLGARGLSDEDIDILLALQQKRLSPAQTIELFSRGLLPQNEAEDRLIRAGYGREDALRLLSLHVRGLTQGQVVDALRAGLLNREGASVALQKLGFTAEAVDIILAFAERRLSAGDIQAAVLRGLISPELALVRLEALGYSREDAQLILELRIRLFTRGMVLDAYAAGFLTRADAASRLVELGYTPEDAELVLRLEDAALARAQTPRGTAPAVARARVTRPRRATLP